jgi:hypothetical protein
MEDLKARWPTLRGLTVKEAEAVLGYRLDYHSAARRFLEAKKALRKTVIRYPWGRVNFALGDACLSRIWKIPAARFCERRGRHRRGAPRWSGYHYKPGKPAYLNRAFQKALAEERIKARRWLEEREQLQRRVKSG